MPQFSSLALEHAPWSVSKAHKAAQCPFSFDLTYVRKLRGKADDSSVSKIGSAVHAALENTLNGGQLKRAMLEGVLKHQLTTNERNQALGYANNVASFVKRVKAYNERHGVEKTLVEFNFGWDTDMKPVGFNHSKVFFRGVIDLMLVSKDAAVMVDHKTGTAVDLPTAIERHGEQIKSYAIASALLFPHIKTALGAFHFVSNESILWMDPVSVKQVRDEYFPWHVKFINECCEHIPTKEARRGFWCSFCTHQAACPLK